MYASNLELFTWNRGSQLAAQTQSRMVSFFARSVCFLLAPAPPVHSPQARLGSCGNTHPQA